MINQLPNIDEATWAALGAALVGLIKLIYNQIKKYREYRNKQKENEK